jgi:Ca2+-binding RTX toxin-like protein
VEALSRIATAAVIALFLPASSVGANHPTSCLGRAATIVGPNTHLRAPGHRGVIVGTSHSDVITGGARPEWIVGAGGRDLICGAGGNDYIVGGDWNRRLDEGATLVGGPGDDLIDGSYAGDHIIGGPGGDGIDGEFGDDRIAGRGGDDFVRAQAGADRVRLGAGADHVETSSGDDVVHGGPGVDNISTGAGEDLAFGDGGDDSIHLLWRGDRGYGGAGDDALHGGQGDDRCAGGRGADSATGCERRRSFEAEPPPAPTSPGSSAPAHPLARGEEGRRDGLRAFGRAAPVLHLERFLHRLQGTHMITARSATKHEIERKHVLGHGVADLVDHRYEERLRVVGRVRAMLSKSVERYRLKLILAAVCDQIDRLRWTL